VAADNEDYVYDEASGEWISAADSAARAGAQMEGAVEVRDAVGNLLADGDSVTLIKDLKVKGANTTLKRGTVIRERMADRRRGTTGGGMLGAVAGVANLLPTSIVTGLARAQTATISMPWSSTCRR